ncbi:MAG: hypothetical protein ACREMK_15690 [Gemmatimonadota bacterium]
MSAKLRRSGRISNRALWHGSCKKGALRMVILSRALVLLVFLQAFSLTPV